VTEAPGIATLRQRHLLRAAH